MGGGVGLTGGNVGDLIGVGVGGIVTTNVGVKDAIGVGGSVAGGCVTTRVGDGTGVGC